MDELDGDTDCQFCAEVRDEVENNAFFSLLPPARARRAILARSRHAAVMPSIGALTRGHVLVVPLKHRRAAVTLPLLQLADFFGLVLETYALLKAVYTRPVVAFEHGPALGTSSGACADHAHVHLLPLREGLSSSIFHDSQGWLALRSTSVLPSARQLWQAELGYLMAWDGYQWWLKPGNEAVSQELRRLVANALGNPDEWDWGAFPQRENVERTIADLSGKLKRSSDESPTLMGIVPCFDEVDKRLNVVRKLVRDRVPQQVPEVDAQYEVEWTDPNMRAFWLAQKVIEEADELSTAILNSSGNVAEEIADVAEVLRAIGEAAGVRWAEVEDLARRKRSSKGAFTTGTTMSGKG